MITLRLGNVPIRIGAEPFTALLAPLLHLQGAHAGMTLKERKMHIAQKAFLMLAIPAMCERLRAEGIPFEPPICPRGADYTGWAMNWILTTALGALGGAELSIDYAEMADGSLLVTGVAPTLAGPTVDASHAPHAARTLPAADGDPSRPALVAGSARDDQAGAGPDDRNLALGSLVHPGPDGQRQDAVCEAPAS